MFHKGLSFKCALTEDLRDTRKENMKDCMH